MVTTIHFHFILGLPLLNIGLNHFTISSFHHCGRFPSGYFWSLIYHSTIALFYLLPVNLVICQAQWSFYVLYSLIMFFTQLCSWINLLWTYSCNDAPCMDLSLVLCVVANHCYTFFLYITLLAKWCYWRDWHIESCPAWPLSISVIVNSFRSDLILQKISTSMSLCIFTISPK